MNHRARALLSSWILVATAACGTGQITGWGDGGRDAGSGADAGGGVDAGGGADGGLDAGPVDAGTWTLIDRTDLLPANQGSTTDVILVDIDADGDNDIVWTDQAGPDGSGIEGGVRMMRNQGGTFVPAASATLDGMGNWTFVLAVDVDGDTDLDAVLTRPARTTPQVALLRNAGDGTFSHVETDMPLITGEADGLIYGRATAADVDGDGDLDLLLPVSFTLDFQFDRPNILLMNDGTGRFTRDASGRLPTIADLEDWTICVCAGDLDGDGDADFFIGEAERRQRILVNDGSGFFEDQSDDDGSGSPRLPVDPVRAYHCEVADLDDDGDEDVVVITDTTTDTAGAPVPVASHLFRNDGTGRFTLETLPATNGPRDSRGLSVADVDGDGRLDVVIGNGNDTQSHGGTAIEILRGTGGGALQPWTGLPSWPQGVFGVAAGDLNGNGRNDIVIGVANADSSGNYQNRLLLWERR